MNKGPRDETEGYVSQITHRDAISAAQSVCNNYINDLPKGRTGRGCTVK